MTTTTRKQARADGFVPLTHPYNLPKEQEMLDAVLSDMRRGRIATVLTPGKIQNSGSMGIDVWRESPTEKEQE